MRPPLLSQNRIDRKKVFIIYILDNNAPNSGRRLSTLPMSPGAERFHERKYTGNKYPSKIKVNLSP